MSIRIVTIIQDGKLWLLKVMRCDDCPNSVEHFHSEKTHSPGQREKLYCELREEFLPITFGFDVQDGCPLPSLLDISRRCSVQPGLIGSIQEHPEYIRVVVYENGESEVFCGSSPGAVFYGGAKDERSVKSISYMKSICVGTLLDEMKK